MANDDNLDEGLQAANEAIGSLKKSQRLLYLESNVCRSCLREGSAELYRDGEYRTLPP